MANTIEEMVETKPRRLRKAERAELFERFNGRCAYCGEHLGERWCADHVEPIIRETKYQRGKGFVQTGAMLRPQLDTLENMMPSCAPCNIHKGSYSLESWRLELGRLLGVLNRNYPTYRMAKRIGLIEEAEPVAIKFYFEREPEVFGVTITQLKASTNGE